MIQLDAITKEYRQGSIRKRVLDAITHTFEPGCRVGILGANGSGKSTLLRLIAGTELPTRGSIRRTRRVSWRLGLTSGFHGSLSGYENLRFVARIYGENPKGIVRYVEDFAQLGDAFRYPVKTYSTGMRARLAFALSLALHFDIYLIDETTAVGDPSFQKRCRDELQNRLKTSDIIMVSHSFSTLRQYCTHAAHLSGGRLGPVEPLPEAVRRYQEKTAS
ncbi:MAG TPA: ABC transporter ATP-binding protein [Chthoniobacteraceae bacterium]|nr:ABC transporter ATP-binding protein [Chthoniobacteraceae bacterium]